MSRILGRPLLIGVLAGGGLLAVYMTVVTVGQGFDGALAPPTYPRPPPQPSALPPLRPRSRQCARPFSLQQSSRTSLACPWWCGPSSDGGDRSRQSRARAPRAAHEILVCWAAGGPPRKEPRTRDISMALRTGVEAAR